MSRPSLPGGKCPYCEKPTSLNRAGRIRRHRGLGSARCCVSRLALAEARKVARDAALAFAGEFSEGPTE